MDSCFLLLLLLFSFPLSYLTIESSPHSCSGKVGKEVGEDYKSCNNKNDIEKVSGLKRFIRTATNCKVLSSNFVLHGF
jgi:hypothetical protein